MDDHAFDALTKAWGSATSRRRVLAALLGGVAWLGAASTAEGRLQCRSAGTKCNKDEHCCSGSCVDSACAAPPVAVTCPNDCSGNGTCNTTTGTCTCELPYTGADCSTLCLIANPCERPELCQLACCGGQYGCRTDSTSPEPYDCYCTGG